MKTERGERILLLGDYSNCHRALATGLRALGCDVTVASNGTFWMQTQRDVDISRRPGKLGAVRYLLDAHRLLRGRLSGFDIVAIHDPNFLLLKPSRLRGLFEVVRKRNRSVFLSAMTTDCAYIDMLEAQPSPLRYSEWFIDGRPSPWQLLMQERWQQWHRPELRDYQNFVFDHMNGAVSALYEYHLGMERRLGTDRAGYGGIPIETAEFEPVVIPESVEKVKLFLGRDRSRMVMKGSDLLEQAARTVVERHPSRAELEIVENVPFAEFKQRLRSSHVVLDQIYSYTPATTAMMAMAYGIPVVSGGEPEFYDFIGEHDNRPIVNAPIELEPLIDTIERLVLEPEKLAERGRRSRDFVVKHNDTRVVARRYLDFWLKHL